MAKIETSTTGAGGGAARAASSGAHERQFGMWSSALVGPALLDSLRKLAGRADEEPRHVRGLRRQHPDHDPVDHARPGRGPGGFILAITVWLWFTVLFANFAEALAEGRGKQQAPPCAACAPP